MPSSGYVESASVLKHEDFEVSNEDRVIRSKLDEETIGQQYNNRRLLTADQTFWRWRNIMGDHFETAFDWAVIHITGVSSVGIDLTTAQGKESLELGASAMTSKLAEIFDAEYQGPELAKFYHTKAAKGVMYLANKHVKRNASRNSIPGPEAPSEKESLSPPVAPPEDRLPLKKGSAPLEEEPNDIGPSQKRARISTEGDQHQPEPWTLVLLSARTGHVISRLYMQYIWQQAQPNPLNVDIRSLRAECKSALERVDDQVRFVYVDSSGFNWPFYSDGTLRTQFAEFTKDGRSSTMHIFVEDRDLEVQDRVLFPPWAVHTGGWTEDLKHKSEDEEQYQHQNTKGKGNGEVEVANHGSVTG